ncbi:MAG: hypothetical protein KDC84_03330 [Crocinitomicaceae bacterium]|nr:hypothetical protein [Crocinitomicaceae bacterium]
MNWKKGFQVSTLKWWMLVSFSFFSIFSFSQQLNIPLNTFYGNKAHELYVNDIFSDTLAQEILNRNSHLAYKPVVESRVYLPKRIVDDSSKQYYWITRKIFQEHLFEIEEGPFWCSIDPVFNFEVGTDFSEKPLDLYYRNTRGFFIQGNITSKFSFGTYLYENQAQFISYQDSAFRMRGELYPNMINSTYNRQNAVVNGFARTKPYKTDGLDYAMVGGYISFSPVKQLNIQFGQGAQFIGNGYRSILLSDNSGPYPYLKLNANFWKGKIDYTANFTFMQNLVRYHEFTTTESTYQRKAGTFHYLSFTPHPKVQIGFFEGIIWQRADSLGTKPFDYNFINPVIFVNTAIFGMSDPKRNSVIGLNISAQPARNLEIYSQFMVDDFKSNKWGMQFGLKYFKMFGVKDLMAQVEYNYVSPFTYSFENFRQNYSNNNLPLAHPKGAGFHEGIFIAQYEIKRVFFNFKFNYYNYKLDILTTDNYGTNIFNSDVNQTSGGQNANQYVFDLHLGYRFNKSYNLQFVTGILFRDLQHPNFREQNTYIYVGLRTGLVNQYLDF